MRRMITNTKQRYIDKARELISFDGTKTEIGGNVEIDGSLVANGGIVGAGLYAHEIKFDNNVPSTVFISSISTPIYVYVAPTEEIPVPCMNVRQEYTNIKFFTFVVDSASSIGMHTLQNTVGNDEVITKL